MSSSYEKVNRVSTESLHKHTGKHWEQWVRLLKSAGATHWNHKEIVAFLKKKYKLSSWWQQIVASGFEIVIGRKIEGRNEKGEYSITATKTLRVDSKTVWKAVSSRAGIAIWLAPLSDFHLKPGEPFESAGGVFGEVRTMKTGERIRLKWQDMEWQKPSFVSIHVLGRHGKRTILAINHGQLREARAKNHLREHWKQVLEDLRQLIYEPTAKAGLPPQEE